MNLRYPNIRGNNPIEQLTQLRSYLFYLVEQLNTFVPSTTGEATYNVQGEELSFFELKNLILEATEELTRKINNKLSEIKNYVVEVGTSDVWTYRKWDNGAVELFGIFPITIPTDSVQRGALYESELFELSLPLVITDAVVSICVSDGYIVTNVTVTDKVAFKLMAPESFVKDTATKVGIYITGNIQKENEENVDI